MGDNHLSQLEEVEWYLHKKLCMDNILLFDTIITISFEHIQFDRELIRELPEGAKFYFFCSLI